MSVGNGFRRKKPGFPGFYLTPGPLDGLRSEDSMDFETEGIHYTCRDFRLPEIQKFERQLNTALREGTLTTEELFRAVCTINDGGEGCVPYSMGTRWFLNNIPALVAHFGQEAYCQFLLEADANIAYHFCEVVVIYAATFETIEDVARRQGIAFGMYLRHGAVNFEWLKAFEQLFGHDTTAKLFLERLEATEYAVHVSNTVSDFLRYGDSNCGTAPWSFLTPAELIQAFRICAAKAPSETLDASLRTRKFFGAREYDGLRTELVGKVERIDPKTTLQSFQALPLEQRLRLIRAEEPFDGDNHQRSLANFVRFVVDTAHDLSSKALVEGFLHDVFPKFEQADPAVVYRNARAALRPPVDFDARHKVQNRNWIINEFDVWLAGRKDIFLGVVTEGRHHDRRQLQVVKDGFTYVHDRHAHRYFPQVGHRVLIKPKYARHLTPKVLSVAFLPVHTTDSVY